MSGQKEGNKRTVSVVEDLYLNEPEKEPTTVDLIRLGLYLALLGVLSCLTAFLVEFASKLIKQFRVFVMDQFATPGDRFAAWVISAVVCSIASAILTRLQPQAMGSGIPEFKAHMDGVHFEDHLSARTLFVKAVGIALALGAGLSIGKEGPFVHMAAIVATLLMQVPGLYSQSQVNLASQLQALGAAAAVGVVATFGAPVGGVLFSIEVTANFYPVKNLPGSFFTVFIGLLFVRKALQPLLGVHDLTLFATDFPMKEFNLRELLAFIILGVISALSVSLLLILIRLFAWLRNKTLGTPLSLSLLSACSLVTVVGALCAVTQWFLGGPFMEATGSLPNALFASGEEESKMRSLLIPLGLSVPLRVIETALSLNLPVPCGCFTPTFLLGAALGRFYGELLAMVSKVLLGVVVHPGNYAVVGAAACSAAATHTVSAAVIAFELTGQAHLLLPLGLAVAASYIASTPGGVYEVFRKLRGIPHLKDGWKNDSGGASGRGSVAGDECRALQGTEFVSLKPTLGEVASVLSSHQSSNQPLECCIPIVDNLADMILVGSISPTDLQDLVTKRKSAWTKVRGVLKRRKLLAAISRNGAPSFATMLSSSSHPEQVSEDSSSNQARLSEVLSEPSNSLAQPLVQNSTPLLSSSGMQPAVDDEESASRSVVLDLKLPTNWVKVDQAPFTISSETPGHKVQLLFKMLRLKSAFVTSNGGVLLGTLYRTDLMVPS